jgi:hypothetical protein
LFTAFLVLFVDFWIPDFFALIYVNIPDLKQIAVINRNTAEIAPMVSSTRWVCLASRSRILPLAVARLFQWSGPERQFLRHDRQLSLRLERLKKVVGVISPSGNEVGLFLSIEQAALAHSRSWINVPFFLAGR